MAKRMGSSIGVSYFIQKGYVHLSVDIEYTICEYIYTQACILL